MHTCFIAVWGADYTSLSAVLMFESCENRTCVQLEVVDDTTAERRETFNITLERTPNLDNRIFLYSVNGVVTIGDDDGNGKTVF